ncbi:MAG: trypsin-like peptidase domain-containing protein [Patescibacteria group bacterium]|nr:trypsin-like peptidase domain-containing protein [Patescibacteria group bacterium]
MSKKRLTIFIVTTMVFLFASLGLVQAQTSSISRFIDLLRNLIQTKNQNQLNQSNQPNQSSRGLESVFQNQAQSDQYQPVDSYERDVINVINQASPAVVSIAISKTVPITNQENISPLNNNGLNQFLQQNGFGNFFQFQAPVQEGTTTEQVGGGSGFIVSPDGYIITNKHVVDDPKATYTVYLNDGRKFQATVAAIYPFDDIAIIKIQADDLPYLTLGDSDKIVLGQTVVAIGNALGEFRNTVSVGVVSGLKRNLVASDNFGNVENLEDLIQTDAAINFGNSGGPLISLRGQVIGVNTAIVSGAQSIGFALPINRFKQVLSQVEATGRIEVPYLGIRYLLINNQAKNKFNLAVDQGAYIYSADPNQPAILPNSPAAKAGLKPGDIILTIDGRAINQQTTPTQIISHDQIGQIVVLKILRGDQIISIPVQLQAYPTTL